LITQDQLPLVALSSMNDTHLEEMIIINKLDSAAKSNNIDEVRTSLQELIEHTAMHFFDEEDMMEEALFPALAMHKAEHDRHQKELQSVAAYFEKHQDPSAITAYIDGSLTPWLLHHIQTMDSVTAQFMQEGLSGGCGATKGCTTGSC